MLKIIFRVLYRALPLKRPILELLRGTSLANLLPKNIRRFLVFSAPFIVQTEAGDFKLLNGYGREIESTIFWEGADAFESTTMPWWSKLAQRSTYIVDIGANTGVYSLIAKTCNPKAQIYAFEPLQRIHITLEENFQMNRENGAVCRLNAHKLALSDYSGSGKMFDLPVEHMYTASLNHDVHAERGQPIQSIQESVTVMRIDDFLHQQNIQGLDLIKIDVESHEPAVIRGMGESLRRYRPTMIVEIWNNDVGVAVEEALKGCDYLYFSLFKTIPEQTQHVRNNFPDKGFINYLICTNEIASELGLLNGL